MELLRRRTANRVIVIKLDLKVLPVIPAMDIAFARNVTQDDHVIRAR